MPRRVRRGGAPRREARGEKGDLAVVVGKDALVAEALADFLVEVLRENGYDDATKETPCEEEEDVA